MEQKIVDILSGILIELHKLNEFNIESLIALILNTVTSIATVAAAIVAAKAATYSKHAAEYSRQAVKEQMKESIPFIIIDRVEAANFKENDKYPVYVYLSNIGKGVARVLVVDLNSSDIRVDIGTPISVGPSGTTHIKIWLPKKDEPKKLLFSVYFWDIDKMCYRTEFNIVLKVTDIPTGGYIASYGSEKEHLTPIGKKEPPEKVLHWPRDSYFEKPWW